MKDCPQCGRSLTVLERYATGVRYVAQDSIGQAAPAEVYGRIGKCSNCRSIHTELDSVVEHDLGLISASGLSKSQLAGALAALHIRAADILAAQCDKKAARDQLVCAFVAASQINGEESEVYLEQIRFTATRYEISTAASVADDVELRNDEPSADSPISPTPSTGALLDLTDHVAIERTMTTLPRFAMVALGARTARRVLPSYVNCLNIPKQYRHMVQEAVEYAEDFAAGKLTGTEQQARDWYVNIASGPIRYVAHVAENERAKRAAMAASYAASCCFESEDPTTIKNNCGFVSGVLFNALFASDDQDCVAHAILEDLSRLQLASRRQQWSNSHHVSQEFFGELWSDGPRSDLKPD